MKDFYNDHTILSDCIIALILCFFYGIVFLYSYRKFISAHDSHISYGRFYAFYEVNIRSLRLSLNKEEK